MNSEHKNINNSRVGDVSKFALSENLIRNSNKFLW